MRSVFTGVMALAMTLPGLAQGSSAQSEINPTRYNSWKGFIYAEGREIPAKLEFSQRASAMLITARLFDLNCSVILAEPSSSQVTFTCIKDAKAVTIYAALAEDGTGTLTMSGQWLSKSFAFCPEYPNDDKRTDECLKSISKGSQHESFPDTTERSATLLYKPLNTQTSERIDAALPKVESALTTLNAKGLQISSESHSAIEFMGEFYTQKGKAPDRYAYTLESMAELLTRAAETPANPQTQALVKDIQENLQLMFESSRPASANPSAELQRIVIKTQKASKEVSGWEIFYMEYFFLHVRDKIGPDSFSHPSSPTEAQLPPSRYVIQAVNIKTGAKSEPKVITVHDHSDEFVIPVK